MRKIIITGISGFLGSTLAEKFSKHNQHNNDYSILGLYASFGQLPDHGPFVISEQVDIRDMEKMRQAMVGFGPDIIIHCAALRDLAYCESHPDEAEQVNVYGTKNIIRLASELGSKLVFISTDIVFDGVAGAYNESSETQPLNKYGETKAACENLIKSMLPEDRWLIVRISVLFGAHPLKRRDDYVKQVLDKLRDNQEVNVLNDKYRNVTYVHWAAETIRVLTERDAVGVYHVCGDECISYQKWTEMIADEFGLSTTLLAPVTLSEMHNDVIKPNNLRLDNSKLRRVIGEENMMPNVREILRTFKTDPNYQD